MHPLEARCPGQHPPAREYIRIGDWRGEPTTGPAALLKTSCSQDEFHATGHAVQLVEGASMILERPSPVLATSLAELHRNLMTVGQLADRIRNSSAVSGVVPGTLPLFVV